MSDYPEHDKLTAVAAETQTVGKFLDWAQDRGYRLMRVVGGRPYLVDWMPVIAEWAGIDMAKIDQEKRDLLAKVRARDAQ